MDAAAVAGLGGDGPGFATVGNCGSDAAEAVGRSAGAAGMSLLASRMRATVPTGGVDVGSGTRATGSDGVICDARGEAEGVADSGVSPPAGRAPS